MFNQKGGVFVRLSSKQLERLYEVRKPTTNTACGANALNVLGLDYEIIQTMGEGGRSGTSAQQAIENLQRFVNNVRRGERPDRIVDDDYGRKLIWVKSQGLSVPRSKNRRKDPSNKERHQWTGWKPAEKKKIKQWLNKNIPEGYITILGIPGHWVVVGRTAGQGNLIIIESQQGGSEGIGSNYDCGFAGVYIGEREVMEYLERIFRVQGYNDGDNNLIIPNKVMFINAAEPEYQEERYVEPLGRLQRQPSTFSILGEDEEDYEEDYEEWGSAAEEEHYEQDTQEYHSGDGDVTMSDVDSVEEHTTGLVGSQGAVWNTQAAPAPQPFHVSTTAFPPGTTTGFGAPSHHKPIFGQSAPAPQSFHVPPKRTTGFETLVRQPAPQPFHVSTTAFPPGTTTGFGAPSHYKPIFGQSAPAPSSYGGGRSLNELMKPRTRVKPGKFSLKK